MGYRSTVMNRLHIGIGSAVTLAVIASLMLGQHACDSSGYWPRSEQTRVYTGGDWPDNEMRKCAALPRADGTIYFLGCVDAIANSDEASMTKVTFWGRTQREDRFQALHSEAMDGWHWNCKKSGESLTCYAVN